MNPNPSQNDSLFPKVKEFILDLAAWVWEGIQERKRDVKGAVILAGIAAAVLFFALAYMIRTDPKWARLFHQPIPAETMHVQWMTFNEVVGAGGTIEQGATVSITAKTTQRVAQIAVDIGQVVQKGDLLVKWDDRLAKAAFDSGVVSQENSKKNLERQKILKEKGFASEMDVETAEATFATARQQGAQTRIDLENTILLSPATAIVLDRTANAGETTKMDAPVMTLGVLDFVYLTAQVAEDKLSSIHIGLEADVTVDAFPSKVFKGTVVRVQPQVAASTRTFNAYVKIPNPDILLKPGAVGYTRISNSRKVLAIPSTAVINPLGETAIVYAVDEHSTARIQEIRCGASLNGWTEVLSGLREGDRVITVGQQELVEGSRVRPNQYTKPKPQP